MAVEEDSGVFLQHRNAFVFVFDDHSKRMVRAIRPFLHSMVRWIVRGCFDGVLRVWVHGQVVWIVHGLALEWRQHEYRDAFDAHFHIVPF